MTHSYIEVNFFNKTKNKEKKILKSKPKIRITANDMVSGKKYRVKTLEELKKEGWKIGIKTIRHPLNGGIFTFEYNTKYAGKDVTIKKHPVYIHFVNVEGNFLPVSMFDVKTETISECSEHIEGQTPIGGKIICKNCGKNLRSAF